LNNRITTNITRKSNLINLARKSINVNENKSDLANKASINKPYFKEYLKEEREDNELSFEIKNSINEKKNFHNHNNELTKTDNNVRDKKKSVIFAKTAANQAIALLPKSLSMKKKNPKIPNSIIPNMN